MGLDSFVYRVKDSKKEEVIYWRKANQIHNWFITKLYEDDEDNNLVPKTFSSKLLDELQEVCQEVLNNNKKLASSKLPTCEGFFFGDTDYDNFYFKQLEYTVDSIKKLRELCSPEEWKNEKFIFYSWF